MTKILITGPILPPAGGISIHIFRLKYLLEDEFDLDFIDESTNIKDDYFNIRTLNLFGYIKKASKTDILFIHSGNNFFKKLHIILGKILGKKIIITIHGYRNKKKFLFRNLDRYIYQLADKIILVNNEILKRIPLNKLDKCVVRNAFLPPTNKHEFNESPIIQDWIIKAKTRYKYILCANASRLDIYNNEDLYGLDMCIEVTRRLLKKNVHVFLIFVVTSLDRGKERYYNYIDKINSYNLQNDILLINESVSFIKIIEQSDLVLRPTNIDGDAITIREALFLNKPVLASDAIERPAGTLLFKNRDFDDFEIQLEFQLKQLKNGNHNNQLSNNDKNDYKEFYVNLLNSVSS